MVVKKKNISQDIVYTGAMTYFNSYDKPQLFGKHGYDRHEIMQVRFIHF